MKTILINKWATGIVLALLTISFTAWKASDNSTNHETSDGDYYKQDTIKPKKKYKYKYNDDRDYKIHDLDKAIKELDKASIEIDRDLKIDLDKMEVDIKKAMDEIKKVDLDKIQVEINKAMKEVAAALKEIDFKEIDVEMSKARKELKSEKFKHDIDLKKIKTEVEKGLSEAREGINTAKKQLERMKSLVDALDRDGLISKKGNYKIQVKDHKLFINGKAQSDAVNKKYSQYLTDDDYTLTRDADDDNDDIEI